MQIASASAGFGDALLFGTGPALRRMAGADGSVNMRSGAYFGGAVVGTLALTAATAGAATAARAAEAAVVTGEKVSAIGLTKIETEGMRAFFKSEGAELGSLSKEALIKYRAAAESALSGEGKRVTEKVIEVQTKRITLIDEALKKM
jgi:hypothetical protein